MFKINTKLVLASTILSLVAASQALATAPSNGFGTRNVPSGLTASTDLAGILMNITNYILGFVTIVAVLMLIWGGIQYLTAAGDEGMVDSAKHTITYAIIGLVVVGISYAIMVVVVSTFIQGTFA